MTRVSVVVPARNAAGTIGSTLSGLEAQRFADEFEVIVVDDGSSDETRKMARASRVVSEVLELRGRGPAAARNAGAERARGAKLAFLDSDCEPVPEWLAEGVAALEDADYVQGKVVPRGAQPLG